MLKYSFKIIKRRLNKKALVLNGDTVQNHMVNIHGGAVKACGRIQFK